MLTHPDAQVQILLDDIAEQRDVAMVKCSNLTIACRALSTENESLKAEVGSLKAQVAAFDANKNGDLVPGHDGTGGTE